MIPIKLIRTQFEACVSHIRMCEAIKDVKPHLTVNSDKAIARSTGFIEALYWMLEN